MLNVHYNKKWQFQGHSNHNAQFQSNLNNIISLKRPLSVKHFHFKKRLFTNDTIFYIKNYLKLPF